MSARRRPARTREAGDGEIGVLGGRGLAIVAVAVAVAIVMLPTSIVSMLQLSTPVPSLPVASALIATCALLHAASVLAAWWPTPAFAVGALCMLVIATLPIDGMSSAALLPSSAAFLLLEWQMAARSSRLPSTAALVVGLVGAGIVTGGDVLRGGETEVPLVLLEALGLAAVVAAAWAFGALSRSRRLAAESRADQRVRSAVGAERLRISRDLHDVVSHSLTVMIAQADAARVLVDEPRAAEALDRVAETGRGAMQGLRGMLRVLDDESRPTTPTPSLAELETLVRGAETSDHHTSFVVRGTPRRLPPDADLALYRAVQEALTNAIRHVRPPVHIRVEVAWEEDAVHATVADDGGAGAARGSSESGGTGLIGMAERVHRAGGSLRIWRGRGWTVTATIPVGVLP